ncbi:MAG: histidine phosphatase family protein [Verrucomicrobiota bacterium]
MTTHLILISHAPTRAVQTTSFPEDEPLDPPIISLPEIKQKIENMGQLNHLCRGPERRAFETAEALQLRAAFTVEQTLRDCDYGRWAGRRFDDLQNKEPDAIASWISQPEVNPHGGESLIDLLTRISIWMDIQGQRGGRILAVSHPSVIRAAILHTIGAPSQSFWRINIEPLSITDLRGNKGHWTLRSISSVI